MVYNFENLENYTLFFPYLVLFVFCVILPPIGYNKLKKYPVTYFAIRSLYSNWCITIYVDIFRITIQCDISKFKLMESKWWIKI